MKKFFQTFLCLFLLCSLISCVGRINTRNVVGAASNLIKSQTITDGELMKMSAQLRQKEDRTNRVAPPNSPYTIRLSKLMANLSSVNGIPLRYKVYLTKSVNANAAPDGSVRVFSGLMDVMNDDELRFVLGHEIGHVALQHTKKRLRSAYLTAAARQAVGIYTPAGVFSDSILGSVAQAFVNSQYSQKNELEADAYGLEFMHKNRYNLTAAITCMGKLQGKGGFFSTHPSSQERIKKLQAKIIQLQGNKGMH